MSTKNEKFIDRRLNKTANVSFNRNSTLTNKKRQKKISTVPILPARSTPFDSCLLTSVLSSHVSWFIREVGHKTFLLWAFGAGS